MYNFLMQKKNSMGAAKKLLSNILFHVIPAATVNHYKLPVTNISANKQFSDFRLINSNSIFFNLYFFRH